MKILLVHNNTTDIQYFSKTLYKIDSSIEFESAKICNDALRKITDPTVRLDVVCF